MHSDEKVRAVFAMRSEGMIQREIATRSGVSLGQVRKWLHAGEAQVLGSSMRSSQIPHTVEGCSLIDGLPIRPYAYLLGQYLGDGHIVAMKNGVHRLGITTCDDYPEIRADCIDAIHAVMPNRSVFTRQLQGATDVMCYSKHWTCVFPQHGRGRKHERRIELEPWQRRIALDAAPEDLIRGLIQSDGCRAINRVVSKGKSYEYVRYFFSNRSDDIRMIFLDACDALGVEARHNNPFSISIARSGSVAILEEMVGPKT